MNGTRTALIAGAAIAILVAGLPAAAGVEPCPWRPASLVATNLMMQGGRPFVAPADLARALGGSGRWDPARLRYEIQAGPGGVLAANPGALAAFAALNARHGVPPAAGDRSVVLSIGGAGVAIESSEVVMLRPAEPAISLSFVARLLGGQARFDAGKGIWVLPAGDQGTPLRFR